MLLSHQILRKIILKYKNKYYLEAAGIVQAAEGVALEMFLNPHGYYGKAGRDLEIIRWALNRLNKDGKWPYGEKMFS
jgi:hypothetical protein